MLFISNVIIRIKNQAIHNLRLSWWTLLHLSKVKVGGALLPARDCGVALSEAVDLLWMLSHNFLTQPIAKWITADSIIWQNFFLCRNYRREHVLPVSNVAWITKLYFRTKKDRKFLNGRTCVDRNIIQLCIITSCKIVAFFFVPIG